MANKLERFLENAITVKELKDMLDDFDDNMKVVFTYNYGDYSRTEVASQVTEVEDGFIEWSEYHRMGKVPEDQYKEEDNEMVLIIK